MELLRKRALEKPTKTLDTEIAPLKVQRMGEEVEKGMSMSSVVGLYVREGDTGLVVLVVRRRTRRGS